MQSGGRPTSDKVWIRIGTEVISDLSHAKRKSSVREQGTRERGEGAFIPFGDE